MKRKAWVMAAVAIGAMGWAMVTQADQPKSAYQILSAAYKAAQAGPPKECQAGALYATKSCISALQYKTIENFAQAMLNVAPLIDQTYIQKEVVDVVVVPDPSNPSQNVLALKTIPKNCQNDDIYLNAFPFYLHKATGKATNEFGWAQPKGGAVYLHNATVEDYQPGDQYLAVQRCLKKEAILPSGFTF